ncbi:MAG TPA: alpha/beta hydrolase-fold protein [Acidobacteriaceae bacterium]|nr:alpha/beta hydrolase-fold protein [Acidobacteriaceae bacterium]
MGTQIQPGAEPQRYPPPGGYEHPRVRKYAGFRSRVLKANRDVTVYVPPGYEEAGRRAYPVLILQDGQNLFDPETSFIRGQTWRVAEMADAAIGAGAVEPLVIVGVANGGERRLAEYTPSRDWKMGGGDAGKYGEMVTRELLPFVRAEYRIREGAEHTGIGGSSLGGLVSLWMGLRYPEIFGKLAVLSPSVWWNHKYIVSYLNDRSPELAARPRVWLDVGNAEGRRTLADAELLDARMRAHGWRTDVDLHFERVAGGKHDEASWAERVEPMLQFLFPGT